MFLPNTCEHVRHTQPLSSDHAARRATREEAAAPEEAMGPSLVTGGTEDELGLGVSVFSGSPRTCQNRRRGGMCVCTRKGQNRPTPPRKSWFVPRGVPPQMRSDVIFWGLDYFVVQNFVPVLVRPLMYYTLSDQNNSSVG